MLGGKKTGGMNVYVRDLSMELSRQGILVDVFTRSQDDCQPMINHELGFNGRVIHIPAGPEEPIPVAEVANYLDEFSQGVLDFAGREGIQYNVIHSHYWLSGIVAEKLRQVWGTPIVQMFHTLGHMKNKIATSDNQRAPQIRLDGETHVMQIADRLIAATPAEEEQLLTLYHADPTKIEIVPPGVDLERFRPLDKRAAKKRVGIPCGDANILFAGRIEPLKGIDTMLRAMAIIQDHCPAVAENCCMVIIGGDPWADDLDDEMVRLQELCADLDIHDLVVFLGAKDQEILPNYYAAAEMVVMPSHYESFGMVALEAMAMGTPVIASEVGGLAHLVKHEETGFHVPSRDPDALAARIYEMLANPACREYLGHNAREYAQQYAWPNIVEQLATIYEALLPQPETATSLDLCVCC
ncbi:MAG: glycosyltransferase family 1 protein [Chloroflexi bacterium]|nr:glycosyltransferase family 1 protein [Chloroflexota bacterium]